MTKNKFLKKLLKQATRGFPRPVSAWAETLVLAALAAWLWVRSVNIAQEDMMLRVSEGYEFFWPLVCVLLVALRYGFTKGFCAALFTGLITLAWYREAGLIGIFSYTKVVGLMLVAMISGEFRDAWEERVHRNDLDYAFMSRKIDLFTQNYFTLRASHDQLEQRMAGQAVSLRSNISELEKISEKNPILGVSQEERLKNMAPAVLTLISQIVGIETAGFYAIGPKGEIDPKPLAELGSMPPLDLEDPMVEDLLECGNLLSPIDLYSNEKNSAYQLAIPLKDDADNLLACVIVTQVKFFTLTDQNIAILNLVVRYAADMLSTGIVAPVIDAVQKRLFVRYLGAALRQQALHHEDSSVIFCRGDTEDAMLVFDKIASTRRGADIYWMARNAQGTPVLVVLLPLTSLVQAQLFADRVAAQFKREGADSHIEIVGPQLASLDDERFVERLKALGLENYLKDLNATILEGRQTAGRA